LLPFVKVVDNFDAEYEVRISVEVWYVCFVSAMGQGQGQGQG